eukprot:TRINITY_DN23939_c0_g1_i1.p1 TRINITY_DN23939_c0_g1~~TRINITY_DN23939_c0_g1_i1.p1  ORF type:complete len:317 (+),score=58.84 TRINITY_DN23939_c0_g1_i1:91-951(+)
MASGLPPAALLCRHGERDDYAAPDKAAWISGPGKERPWDPALTAKGKEQARQLGRRLREGCGPGGELGCAPPTRVFSSPFVRAVETAAEVAKELGISEVLIEAGLAECMVEDWFRSWAVPGADTAWGGPPHCGRGVPVAESELRPEALCPAACIRSAEEVHNAGHPVACPTHQSVHSFAGTEVRWGRWERSREIVERGGATITQRLRERPGESAVFVSHGGPCSAISTGLTGADGPACAGYCALYVMHAEGHEEGGLRFKAHPGVWGCSAHLKKAPSRRASAEGAK